MKTKKNLAILVAVFACIFGLTFSADAQKRKAPRKKIRTVPISATLTTNSEIKAGAEKVSTQIKNVTKFLYVLGGIARNIEDVDKEAKTKKVSPAGLEQNAQFKQSVIQSIRNLRAGLAALEIEFRTKPALKNYLIQIQGISDTSGIAEDQATAGQFNESGKTLLRVVEKLSDTLAAMP